MPLVPRLDDEIARHHLQPRRLADTARLLDPERVQRGHLPGDDDDVGDPVRWDLHEPTHDAAAPLQHVRRVHGPPFVHLVDGPVAGEHGGDEVVVLGLDEALVRGLARVVERRGEDLGTVGFEQARVLGQDVGEEGAGEVDGLEQLVGAQVEGAHLGPAAGRVLVGEDEGGNVEQGHGQGSYHLNEPSARAYSGSHPAPCAPGSEPRPPPQRVRSSRVEPRTVSQPTRFDAGQPYPPPQQARSAHGEPRTVSQRTRFAAGHPPSRSERAGFAGGEPPSAAARATLDLRAIPWTRSVCLRM